MAVLYSPYEEDSIQQMSELARLTEQQNIDLLRLVLKSRGDLKKLNDLEKGDAVFITGSGVAHVMIKKIMSLLRQKKIPAVDVYPDSLKEGALITLYQNPEKQGWCAAENAAKLIAGEQVEKIKSVVLTETELVFNVAQAGKLGISFPAQLIGEATRVIE